MFPQFPSPTMFGGRLRFIEAEVESYKRLLAGLPAIERAADAPTVFVTAQKVCADLGIDRRTLGRRVRGRVKDGDSGTLQ